MRWSGLGIARLAGVALVLGISLAVLVPVIAQGSGPTPPSSDPFYTYKGSLRRVAPGTILRTRQVQIVEGGQALPLKATQVLYRTQNQLRQPSATVATIIYPAAAAATPIRLLSYQTFYDGVASTCRPSYSLRGGTAPSSTGQLEEQLILNYVNQGYTVVTSDYEGPTDDYGAGRESGYGTLDAIRAAEHLLKLAPRQTPVGLIGYSGGSIASEWASQLAPTYAPTLHLIGVAEGGIPVDYWHNMAYINGSQTWAGAIPAVSIGLMRAYKLSLRKYASRRGLKIFQQVKQGCLDPGAYPGLRFQDLLKPRYKDYKQVPIFVRILNDHIMGRGATPREPLLMEVGNADGTGDGVMVARDVQELAYLYCRRGVPVEFHVFRGANHDEAAVPFETQALAFLQARYAGLPATSNCGTFGPGNSLKPVPRAHRSSARSRDASRRRRRRVSFTG